MKKLFLTGIIALNYSLHAQIPATTNLIGRWEFSGNANDLSSSLNHGVVYGASLIPDRCGNSGSAYHFNGTSDYIQMQQWGPGGSASRTIAFWMRSTNTVANVANSVKAIFAYGNGSGSGDSFEIEQNYCTQGVGLDVNNQATTYFKSCLNDGNWHHVAAVYDNAISTVYSTVKFYFDGVLQGQTSSDFCNVSGISQTINTGVTQYPITIGRDQKGSTRFFNGDLDDFYLYNIALSSSQVQQLYNLGCNITGNSTFCNNNNVFSTPPVPGATSYVWTLPSGWSITGSSSGPTIFVNASSGSGVISVAISSPCGTIVRSVNWTYAQAAGTPVSISVSNPNLNYCTNASNGLVLTANSTYNGPVSYYWQPVGQNLQSVTVYPASNTVYYVIATATGFCPSITNVNVTVTDDCCDHQIDNVLTSTLPNNISGTYSGGSYLITQNVVLTGNTSFINSEFQIMPNVKITVPSGLNLDLSGSHLYSCGLKMWDGIVVNDGGAITTSPSYKSNLIEDAKIAIDLNNITTGHANPPINISDVTFNKNHIGIKLSNSTSGVTSLPISVLGCVFTCRNLPFNTSTWPSASTSDLRLAVGSIIGLDPIYLQQTSYPICNNIKIPYNNQTSLVGIKIENVGNVPATAPTTGVDIGVTYQGAAASGIPSDFNLFDNLGVGIDVTDASLTTMNNVFQNMNYNSNVAGMTGSGIEHRISNQTTPNNSIIDMNARLDLRPVGVNNQSNLFSNRFWNCYIGIKATNVYEVFCEYGLFRSNHKIGNTLLLPGDQGILLESNRFSDDIKFCEFHNLNYGITVNSQTGNYDMGSGPNNGIYATNMNIEQNYFGPQVTSSTPLTTEYFNQAIRINGPNMAVYNVPTAVSRGTVISNKINRVYRGVSLNSMFDYPITISNNNILLVDDLSSSMPQRGIEAYDNQGNLVISDNSLWGSGTTNQLMTLIYCRDNSGINSITGTGSPYVTCNSLTNSYQGFEFENFNANSNWLGNSMRNHFYGLLLTNAVIGTQGNLGMGCGNQWISCFWDTWCNGSNPSGSSLYCSTLANFFPVNNGGSPNSYLLNTSLFTTKRKASFNCPATSYPPQPTQRMANVVTGMEQNKISETSSLFIYPNPSTGNIVLTGMQANTTYKCLVADITGKTVFEEELTANDTEILLNLNLNKGVYFIKVSSVNQFDFNKKLIIE